MITTKFFLHCWIETMFLLIMMMINLGQFSHTLSQLTFMISTASSKLRIYPEITKIPCRQLFPLPLNAVKYGKVELLSHP